MKMPSAEERARVNIGWQCPECFGTNIDTPQYRNVYVEPKKYTCRDCGCVWDRHRYPSLVVRPPEDK